MEGRIWVHRRNGIGMWGNGEFPGNEGVYRGGGNIQEVANHFPSGENLTAEIPAS
jgi:hypothetical protein